MRIIYFDNNATTPIDERVLDSMVPFLKDNFANPGSSHYLGTIVSESVRKARTQVADLINAEENEIIFTSSSTEAINIALKGAAETSYKKGKHIITVSTEHKAVLATCKYLETKGYEITYLPVKKDGLIDLNELKKSLRADTILVCVMYVNNETGVIQSIKDIASLAHEAGALFMTDATQAAGKIEINVNALGVDLLCLSGHKMYAPKGVGCLYVGQNIKLPTFIHGGGQENGLRSGTLNVPGIVAFGTACEIAMREMKEDAKRIISLRNDLEFKLLKIPETFINGSVENRIYNVSNICFRGIDANVIIGRMKSIAVSNGAACSSSVIKPSHVLNAMGLIDDDAFASIRFSLGKFNTESDVSTVVKKLTELTQNIK